MSHTQGWSVSSRWERTVRICSIVRSGCSFSLSSPLVKNILVHWRRMCCRVSSCAWHTGHGGGLASRKQKKGQGHNISSSSSWGKSRHRSMNVLVCNGIIWCLKRGGLKMSTGSFVIPLFHQSVSQYLASFGYAAIRCLVFLSTIFKQIQKFDKSINQVKWWNQSNKLLINKIMKLRMIKSCIL